MQIQTIGASRTMSSREIAELTQKNHADVLRDIRNTLEQLGITASSFAGSYIDSTGRCLPLFNLPEDLTITLVSGYSVQMRHRIVKRWQELEAGALPALPRTFAEALRALADKSELAEQQAAALALAAPKVEFVDRYVTADSGAKGFRQVAKLLKANEARLREFLISEKIMYRLSGDLVAHQNHIDAGRFECKTGEANGHAFSRCLFSPKGVEWLAGEWAKHQIRGEVAASD